MARTLHITLGVLMALMLATGNAALSGHAASHVTQDTGSCALCIQAGASDDAITADPANVAFTPAAPNPFRGRNPAPGASAVLQIHPARAPPLTV